MTEASRYLSYPKINTIWKRNPKKKHCIIPGEYALPSLYHSSKWRITEKIDGTNIRIVWDGQIKYFGRQAKSEIPPLLKESLEKIFDGKSTIFQDIFGKNQTILFGEGFGGRISGGTIPGKKYHPQSGFILFDIWTNKSWCSWDEMRLISEKLQIPSVPSFGVFQIEQAVNLVKDQMMSGETSSFFGDFCPEGIVATIDPLELSEARFPIKWKLKVKDYQRLKSSRNDFSS